MGSRKLTRREQANLAGLVRDIDILADHLKIKFHIKKADAYSYLNSLAPIGTKLVANAALELAKSGDTKKVSSALGLTESIRDKVGAIGSSGPYGISEPGLSDFLTKHADLISRLKTNCVDLIESLESEATDEREPEAPPTVDAAATHTLDGSGAASDSAHHPLYQVADLAYFDVAVPERNYNPEDGLPIYGSFIFNIANFTADDGRRYQLSLDTCILQTVLTNGEVPVLPKQEVEDDSGKRLKLISDRAYPLPHNPKWRLEAPEQHAGLEGSFHYVRLCNVTGRIEPGERMSMAAPISSIAVTIDGEDLDERSMADAVLKQWLKLTTLGDARGGEYQLGSRFLIEDGRP